MHPRLLVLALVVPLPILAEERTPAPLPPVEAAKRMQLPDGFKATVFAAEPDVVQPISFAIDDRGRLFVAEALNYGEWKATGKDRIIILEDTHGDGRADKRTVFYEGFNYITGIEVGFGGVWVVSPPGLYFIPDRDGDDKPDGPPELIFDGFGYKESRHNLVNGFTWGPDGWLYAGHGRTSPSDVGRPGTPADKRVHCDGGVYRIHPTRLVFENFADGTTNPWGVDFDDYGACFVSNCVNPHLFHMIQGGHYEPWRNRPSSQYAYDRLPTIADHLHYPGGDLRATLGTETTLEMGGGHAHCGMLIYLGGAFPADFRNNAFMCNIHGHRINRDILRRKGSGYTASHGKDFAISADPWFMGVTLRTGPDGSVFVSDWSDTGECHTYKPNTQTGRIFKISYGKPEKPRIDLPNATDDELVKLQSSRNDWYVRHARRLLQERSAKPGWKADAVHTALRAQLDSAELHVPQRLRALWALRVTGGLDSLQALPLLDDRSEYVRAWAVQFLCEGGDLPAGAVTKFADLAKSDPSPVVRLYLASALQRLNPKSAWPIAERLLSHAEDANDANLPLMYWYGIEPIIISDPLRPVLELAPNAKISLVRRFMTRRFAEWAPLHEWGSVILAWVLAIKNSDDEAVQLDLLEGAREGFRGRRKLEVSGSWKELYPRLAQSKRADIRQCALALGLIFDDPQALTEARKTARSRESPLPERVAAIQALIDKRPEDLVSLLQELLKDEAVRLYAIRGLATVPDAITPKLLIFRYPVLTLEERRELVATLSSRKEFALELLDAVESRKIPRSDISAYAARQMHALGDREVAERLRTVWGEVHESAPQKLGQLAKYKKLLTPAYLKNADPNNGRLVYSKTCQNCHKLFGEGGAIGPDLTGSNRSNLDYLLSNIIDPSAEVGRDYKMSTVTTADMRVITGIIVERTPARVVIQTATERVTVPAEDVDTVKDSALSIMPDGQLDALSREQVRDLIAYLSGKGQVSLPVGKSNPK